MINHGDAVASLAFDKSGLMLVSGSHDGSIKVHELRRMAQGQAAQLCDKQKAHQLKHNEGVLSVLVHPS